MLAKDHRQLAKLHKLYNKCTPQPTEYYIDWRGLKEQVYMCPCGGYFETTNLEVGEDLYQFNEDTKPAYVWAVYKALPKPVAAKFWGFMRRVMEADDKAWKAVVRYRDEQTIQPA